MPAIWHPFCAVANQCVTTLRYIYQFFQVSVCYADTEEASNSEDRFRYSDGV